MIKCPFCQFANEEGALFCEQCKSDLSAEPTAAPAADRSAAIPSAPSAIPVESKAEVAAPLAAVAVVEAAVPEAVPVAQMDAAAVAAGEVPIAVAIPLPETAPPTIAPVVSAPGVEMAQVAPTETPPPKPPTLPDISLPKAAAQPEAAPPAAETPNRLPPEAKPKLVVVRGQRMNVEYPVYEGDNYLGRADEKAVDIDLEDQEPPDRIWSSRQHALITYETGQLTIEDLNSTNGTFVNRMRLHPGQKRPLQVNDVIQIGTVHLKVKI